MVKKPNTSKKEIEIKEVEEEEVKEEVDVEIDAAMFNVDDKQLLDVKESKALDSEDILGSIEEDFQPIPIKDGKTQTKTPVKQKVKDNKTKISRKNNTTNDEER